MSWVDLSDDEVAARLRQHGAGDADVEVLVRDRDEPWAAARITGVLDG